MNHQAVLTWTLAAVGLALGITLYGWPGAVMAVTVLVFVLLLDFSRSLRVMRAAAERPVGSLLAGVPSAVMLNSKLKPGLRLLDVLRLTGSLGVAVAPASGSAALASSEAWQWTDEGGDSVQVVLEHGRVTRWQLNRAPSACTP